MALQGSGAIALSEIATEFGGSAPHALSEYYDAASGIPASGVIAFSDFYGTTSWTYGVGGNRGVFAGGTSTNVLDYINIESTGDAADFGDLDFVTNYGMGGNCSDSSRAVFWMGYASVSSSDYRYNVDVKYGRSRDMTYITVGTPGNSTYFGEEGGSNRWAGGVCAVSNGSRGVKAGGTNYQGTRFNHGTLQYITIGTTSNSVGWQDGGWFPGQMHTGRYDHASASNSSRGLFCGGSFGSAGSGGETLNSIEYIAIGTTTQSSQNAGDLSGGRRYIGGAASDTRAVFAGGHSNGGTTHQNIDYVAISSTNNCSDFGDLSVTTQSVSGTSNGIRAVFNLNNGNASSVSNNTIEYITIASAGSAADFGNRTVAQSYSGAASGG